MSNLRSALRKIRNNRSVSRTGYFKYFDTAVFCSKGSEILRRISREAVFEPEIIDIILQTLKPNTYLIDIGANIGVIAVPILKLHPNASVLSIECSPSTFPLLEKTHAKFGNSSRWRIDGRAVADVEGELDFFTSGPDYGAFDGLKDTGRGGEGRLVKVKASSLDRIWLEYGSPNVSVIKIDIEGGEYEALMSGEMLITSQQPAIVFEWHAGNLKAHNRDPQSIFDIADHFHGEVYTIPKLHRVTRNNLRLLMQSCEMFLMMIGK